MARRDADVRPLRGVHVLLVCDDGERCALFAHALTYAGALTTVCVSAADAHTVLDRVHANVLVVEVRDAAARTRFIHAVRARDEHGAGLPALALTGRDDDRAALLEAGFHEHVTMPVRADELARTVAALAVRPALPPES
jgi:DNA-binding response OmpR family regulator